MSDDDSVFKYQKEKTVGNVFVQVMFSNLGLFLVVALYTCFGAQMFVNLEEEAEIQRYEQKRLKAIGVEMTINYTTNLLWYYGDEQRHNWTYLEYKHTVENDLKRLEEFIIDAIQNHKYDGTINGWVREWTFMNAALLSMSILTTIGYGNIAPVTFEGQMFCIVYALFGCVIFLVFLANLGDSMAKGFIYIYSRCCCRGFRSRRYAEEVPPNTSKRYAKHVIDDVVGKEDYMPTAEVFVPIVINVVILHIYFLIGGLLFAYWENWNTTSSIYFTFITLSTIGYGDFVAGNSLGDDPNSIETHMKLLVIILYILLGMALLSMCINLMQAQVIEKCRWFSRKIGLSGKDEVSTPKPLDPRKDSLLPLMNNTKGPSPFRSSGDIPDIPEDFVPKQLPGIIVAESGM